MHSSQIYLVLSVFTLALTSCDQIQSKISEFRGTGGPKALPESESLAGSKNLPQVLNFVALDAATFQNFIAPMDRISVVNFSSDTPTSAEFSSVLAQLAGEGKLGVQYGEVKVETSPELAETHGVGETPDSRIFHDGGEIGGFTGSMSAEEVTTLVEQYMASVPAAGEVVKPAIEPETKNRPLPNGITPL